MALPNCHVGGLVSRIRFKGMKASNTDPSRFNRKMFTEKTCVKQNKGTCAWVNKKETPNN